MRSINESELNQISAGHSPLAVGAAIWFIFEIPHMIMGIREFVNYMGERWEQGSSYEQGDYFSAFFCNAYLSVTGYS